MNRFGLVLLALALALIGCKKDGDAQDGANAGAQKGAVSAGGVTLKAVDHVAMFAHVPDGAQVVVTFDMSAFWAAALDHNFGLVPVKADPKGARDAVARASRLTLGIDVTAVQQVVVWASVDMSSGPQVGALLTGSVGDKLEGEKTGEHEGVALVKLANGPLAAKVDAGLLMGTEDSIKAGIAVAKGKGTSLANGQGDAHKKMLKPLGSGAVTATVALGPLAALAPPPVAGLEGGAAIIGTNGVIGISVSGAAATLDGLMDQYDKGLKMARAALEKAVGKRRAEKNPALIGLVYAEQKWGDYTAASKPVREGDSIVSKANIGSGAALGVGAVGVLGAVAVPAFIKYMRRAKTTEAIDQLDKMYKGAAVYYTAPIVARDTGARIPCQFPATVKPTPAPEGRVHPCCGPKDADNDDRCDADPNAWTADTWSALNFQVNDPHYFFYEFESNGKTGSAAAFTAKAYADLDCDGTFSTFERYGYGDETSSNVECSMKGSSAFFKEKETE